MKFIKAGEAVNVKLTLPSTIQWKVGRQVLKDLWNNSEFNESSYLNNPELAKTIERLFELYRLGSTQKLIEFCSSLSVQRIMELAEQDQARNPQFGFFALYQAVSLLKKFPFEGNTDRTKNQALTNFVKLEDQCRLFNTENYKAVLTLSEKHPDYFGLIDEIRGDIKRVLGEYPNFSRIFDSAQHGPGVTNDAKSLGQKTTSFFKWSEIPYSLTSPCLPYAIEAIERDPRWIGALNDSYRSHIGDYYGPIDVADFYRYVFKVVDGNRISTVPKSFETDRTIAIEPRLNVYLQLGVDRVIRHGIKRHWGYDLNDQEQNKQLVKDQAFGLYPDDELVTVDLKGASDTISLKVCELLIPPAWLDLLLDLRSPIGEIKESGRVVKRVTYEKISSMGNGYTFVLESLIFGALVRAACRRCGCTGKTGVFGDDLIIPRSAYPRLYDYLGLFGFSINTGKTFTTGDFRESCGTDYYKGTDVRPLFLTNRIENIDDLLYIHNSLILLEKRLPWTWGVDFSDTRKLIRKYLPKFVFEQFQGPPTQDLDTHLFSDDVEYFVHPKHGKVFYKIIPVPVVVKKGRKTFFFRKLMNQLKGSEPPRFWLKRLKERASTGNAFDVTMREAVEYKATWSKVY